jgi:hypothetical protein
VIELRRPPGQFARVGHRGASALAPENTLEALELAVELGCDMLEFDVLPLRDGTLVLAHSKRELPLDPATLDDALVLAAERFPRVGLQLDLKVRGTEEEVVTALRRRGVVEHSWISGSDARSLRRMAELEPRLGRARTRCRVTAWVSRSVVRSRGRAVRRCRSACPGCSGAHVRQRSPSIPRSRPGRRSGARTSSVLRSTSGRSTTPGSRSSWSLLKPTVSSPTIDGSLRV